MKLVPALLVILLTSLPVYAAEGIETVKIKDHLHVLISPMGGNVVVSSGEDGKFFIDDQLIGRSAIVEAAAKELGEGEIKFILNTHYHFDHTGGNEFFGAKDAVIIAHDNVRKRLSRDEFITFFKREMPALSKEGLPIVTLSSDLTLHINGDEVRMVHVPQAHTDGDTFAHFQKANVIVTGDLVFNGMYPFIDQEHGGSIKGVLNGVQLMLKIADEATLIIPGHGPVMSKSELKSYGDALGTIVNNIEAAIAQGKSRDEVIASKPTAKFDGAFKGGIVNADQFAGIIFDSLK